MTTDEILQRLKSIEADVGALITHLVSDGDQPPAEKPKAKTKKAEPAPTAKAPTIEDVRAALTKLASEKGASVSKQLLKDYGAEKLSDIAAQDFPELLVKVEGAMQ